MPVWRGVNACLERGPCLSEKVVHVCLERGPCLSREGSLPV